MCLFCSYIAPQPVTHTVQPHEVDAFNQNGALAHFLRRRTFLQGKCVSIHQFFFSLQEWAKVYHCSATSAANVIYCDVTLSVVLLWFGNIFVVQCTRNLYIFVYIMPSHFTMDAYDCYCGVSKLYKLQKTNLFTLRTKCTQHVNNGMTSAQETHTCAAGPGLTHTKIKNNMLICTLIIYNAQPYFHSFR